MNTAKLAKELTDRLDDDPKSGQVAHGGSNRGRIQALLACVGTNGLDEMIGQGAKDDLIQFLLNEQLAIVSQGALAKVGVRLSPDVEGVMPGDVERDSFDRGGVGQVMELLEDQRAYDGMEVLGGSTVLPREPRDQFRDGQVIEKMIPKDAGPRLPEQVPALLAKMVPRVEEIAGLMIADCNHADIIAAWTDSCQTFCRPVEI